MTHLGASCLRTTLLSAAFGLGALGLVAADRADGAVTSVVAHCGTNATDLSAARCARWNTQRIYVKWVVTSVPLAAKLDSSWKDESPPVPMSQNCVPNTVFPIGGLDVGNHSQFCRVKDNSQGQEGWVPTVDKPIARLDIGVDPTPPTVTVRAARPPDFDGWYRQPVGVEWVGTDAVSGVASCSTQQYVGPDSGAASISGTCRDVAGNVSAPVPFTFRYDATPPTLSGVSATTRGSSNVIAWVASTDTQNVEVTRTHTLAGGATQVIFSGNLGSQVIDPRITAGATYTYRVTATDQAGNRAVTTLSPTPGAVLTKSLLTPADGKVLRVRPKLRWPAVAKAKYYNVQIHVKGKKVLSVWPTTTRYQIPASWTHKGKKYRLPKGTTIRWFVWPATGTLTKPKFGAVIGTSTFRIAK